MKVRVTITPDGPDHVLLVGVIDAEIDEWPFRPLWERRCAWDGPGLVEDLEDLVGLLAEEARPLG